MINKLWEAARRNDAMGSVALATRAWAPVAWLAGSSLTARVWAVLVALVVACGAYQGGLPPLSPSAPTSFDDRVMGQALASGADVNADISLYYGFLALAAVAGVAALALATALEGFVRGRAPEATGGEKNGEAEAGLAAEDLLGAAREYGYAGVFLAALVPLLGAELWPALACLGLSTLHYALGVARPRGVPATTGLVRAGLMCAFPLGVFAYVSSVLDGTWACAGALLAAVLLATLACLALWLWRERLGRDLGRLTEALSVAALPLLATGVVNSVALEAKNVLAVRGLLDDPRPYAVYVGIVCLGAVASGALLLREARRAGGASAAREARLARRGWALLVLMVLLCAYQPPVLAEYGSEYFESANHGLALYALFQHGELPLVENFDAHMLAKEVAGILYYLLNPYEPWASSVYNGLVCVPVVFLLERSLARLVSERAAATWVLLCPLFCVSVGARPLAGSLGYAIFPLMAIWGALRRPGCRSYGLFCAVMVLTCLLGLDVGVSSIFAAAATFLVAWARSRDGVRIGRLFATGAATVALAGAAWVALCAARGVDPLSRLVEFVTLAASNANWATYPVGDAESLATALCYVALPLASLVLVAWLAVFARPRLGSVLVGEGGARGASSARGVSLARRVSLAESPREVRAAAAWTGALFFACFYLANLSRGIVRHNLSEGGGGSLLSTIGAAALCTVLYVRLSRVTRRPEVFAGLVATSALVCSLMGIVAPAGVSYLADFPSELGRAAEKWSSAERYEESPTEGTRVEGSDADDAAMKAVLDATLEPDETYLTLSSKDFLYAIVDRQNPLYANQSPLMLSGDASQEFALEELADAECVYVLMPRDAWPTADGIDVTFKYYRLAEVVFERYEPFLRVDGADYDVWCLSARRDELERKLDAALAAGAFEEVAGWSYVDGYDPAVFGELGQIPRLWGELDEGDAWGTTAVTAEAPEAAGLELEADEPVVLELSEPAGGAPAYLALDVEAAEDGTLRLTFAGEDAEKARTLSLDVSAGSHRYLVRVSGYYEWWQGDVSSVGLSCSAGATLHELTVREGD